ncbi:hypothetical protein CNMCM8694_008421 [Aspergillus lentulus]|nr:hypothetical protein CNMCM8060_009330 [Aspergillus lentulus]KAF4193731.1 hypothetical protein CNMCM8694_008421 [Aspergillus lentulus]
MTGQVHYKVKTEATMGLFSRPFHLNGQITVLWTLSGSGSGSAKGKRGPLENPGCRFRNGSMEENGFDCSEEMLCFFLIGK